MKRLLVRICVFLVLGAFVNVAVAWGITWRRPLLGIERNHCGYFVIWGRPWQIVLERRMGITDVGWYDLYDENPRSTSPETLVRKFNDSRPTYPMPSGRARLALTRPPEWGTFGREPLAADVEMGGDIACGWPCLSLWMSTTCDIISNRTANDRLHGGYLISGAVDAVGESYIAMPLRPLWPGFAINTVFYAVLLWLLFAGPFVLRRRRRIRRGQCPKCAYPVGASELCTECGAAVRSLPRP